MIAAEERALHSSHVLVDIPPQTAVETSKIALTPAMSLASATMMASHSASRVRSTSPEAPSDSFMPCNDPLFGPTRRRHVAASLAP